MDNQQLGSATNAFGLALYGAARPAEGNFAVSPISVATALTMTGTGAQGVTRAELSTALRGLVSETPQNSETSRALGSLLTSYQSVEGITVRAANRLFGEQSFPFLPAFIESSARDFGAPLESVDFLNAADPARIHINQWVSEQTATRIPELLPAGSLDADTRLVLVNAIYFLANWQRAFAESATQPENFTLTNGSGTTVPTMRRRDGMRVSVTPDLRAIELPYTNPRFVMDVLVPNDLSAFESNLTNETLAQVLTSLGQHPLVDLHLPRFRLEGDVISLKTALQAMGVNQAFDEDLADFGGIAPTDESSRLFVSDVFHRVFVEVNEQGTEAAAATAVVMTTRAAPSMPPDVLDFRVDRPFLFLIRDTESGAILFMGRVANPSL